MSAPSRPGQHALSISPQAVAGSAFTQVAFPVTVRVDGTGTYASGATAASTDDLEADADPTRVVVRQAELGISAECEGTRFAGRNIDFAFTVRNDGDAASTSTVVRAPVPAGGSFVRADNGGSVQGGAVQWNIGNLAAGAERTVTMTIKGNQIGDLRGSATVTADCADAATDSCVTPITGIPAVLLEVVDATDPIEVGETVTYVITATNQGSANDNNIEIECTFPAELEFVGTEGATPGTANGRTVTFRPLGTLAPQQAATWRVILRAVGTGDVRFATSMNTDELTSEVRETEATRLYE